jgi:apolipoprotein N-acyltransferase
MIRGRRGTALGLVGAGALILSWAWLGLGVAPLLPVAAALIMLGFRRAESGGDAFWCGLFLERRAGLPRSLGIVLLWPVLEKLRTLGDLSLPVDLLAHSFGTQPACLGPTAWIGPFGLSLLIFTAGTSPAPDDESLRVAFL